MGRERRRVTRWCPIRTGSVCDAFAGRASEYTTQPNFDDSPHSLHGVGWMRPWEIVSSSAVEVVMRLRHAGDADWPFPFEASQYFTLTPQAMNLQMVFTNHAEIAQPVGLGWHPYFPKRTAQPRCTSKSPTAGTATWPSCRSARSRSRASTATSPTSRSTTASRAGAGRRGSATRSFSLQLTSALPYLVVYTPQDRDYFCIEPVSHVSNAIHMAEPAAHGLRSVAPGESMEASMSLEVLAVL